MSNLLSHDTYDVNRMKCAIRLSEKCRRLVYFDMEYVKNLLDGEANI